MDGPSSSLDPLSYFSSPEKPRALPILDDPQDAAIKQRVRKKLIEAAPSAADRLARVAVGGDEKYAVQASEAILDRVGFSRSEPSANVNPLAGVLPVQALITALLGIGRVMGLKEVEKLKNVTPTGEVLQNMKEASVEVEVEKLQVLRPDVQQRTSRSSKRLSLENSKARKLKGSKARK